MNFSLALSKQGTGRGREGGGDTGEEYIKMPVLGEGEYNTHEKD